MYHHFISAILVLLLFIYKLTSTPFHTQLQPLLLPSTFPDRTMPSLQRLQSPQKLRNEKILDKDLNTGNLRRDYLHFDFDLTNSNQLLLVYKPNAMDIRSVFVYTEVIHKHYR